MTPATDTYRTTNVMFLECWVSANADIDGSHPHVGTEQEEVAMIVETYTVVEPG